MSRRDRRLRILHLAFEDPRKPGSGGGAVRTREVNRRLAGRHEVTVVTTKYPGCAERVEDGVRYVQVGARLGYHGSILTYLLALPLAVRRHPSDLVVEDFAPPFTTAMTPLWTRRPVVAVVQYFFGRQKSRQYRLPLFWAESLGVRLYRDVISVSEAFAAEIRARNPRADVRVLHNGVDPAAREARETGEAERADALFLGRIEMDQKGLDMLLEAYAAVARDTGARLLVAGDGPDRQRFQGRCRELGLGGRVELLGRVEGRRKFELMASARVLCMPSRYEGFPIVAIEAMACGTPVLGFAIPSMSEVLGSGGGALVTPFDVAAYARTLGRLLSSPGACRSLGEAGRAASARFDWDAVAAAQEAVYEAVVEAGGRR